MNSKLIKKEMCREKNKIGSGRSGRLDDGGPSATMYGK